MPNLLALNAGSSSLKYALYRAQDKALRQLAAGAIEGAGAGGEAAARVFREVEQKGPRADIAAVGHRILHGGERYTRPHRIDAALIAELEKLAPLAPEHLPAQIAWIRAISEHLPRVPQVACFDTAFHRHLPPIARTLPIPRRYGAQGVRRYGFHGLSYEFLMEELVRLGDPAAKRGRVILAHLGNGASLAAVKDGVGVDTTMGFTPAAGLVMGRRSGDLDPGLWAYLARVENLSASDFDRMVNHESGMAGISETTSDVRELLNRETSDPRAAEALAVFCYQAAKWIGAMAVALGGVDTLVFAGGIGENSSELRARICAPLGFLGIRLDPSRNGSQGGLVSPVGSAVSVRVVKTDEDLMIVRATCRLLGFEH